jgi:acetyl-CoA acetyltransferase
MAGGKFTPIVVGVGDVVNRSPKVEDAIEPMQLMLQATQLAIKDTNLPPSAARELQSKIDSVDVIGSWTWPYPDLPGLLSEKLAVEPQHKHYSPHGGNQPGKLFDEAARRISLGESKVAIVTGGEALASLSACAAAKKMPPPGWTKLDQSVDSVFSPTARELGQSLGAIHSIGAPIHVYPLFENGLRAHRRQSIPQNNKESAELYAEFAKVAEQNPLAWNYGKPAETAESIGTVTKRNRMICFPYPLLMNAFNTVNLAATCLLTSTAYAKELGIPESKWIYPLAGAGTRDSYDFWERPNYHTSPAISRSLDACLQLSGLRKEDIDLFDFYSCFPIVPKLACQHLGLPITKGAKPITLLGGLTSFGGAGNNYSMHVSDAIHPHLELVHMTRIYR